MIDYKRYILFQVPNNEQRKRARNTFRKEMYA